MKKWLMKSTYILFFVIVSLFASCEKYKQNTCLLDECDSRRYTKVTADNTDGIMFYNNVIDRWGIVSVVIGNVGRKRTSFICGPLNDTFKVADKKVIYSGFLKESCDNPRPSNADEDVYYIQPTMIR